MDNPLPERIVLCILSINTQSVSVIIGYLAAGIRIIRIGIYSLALELPDDLGILEKHGVEVILDGLRLAVTPVTSTAWIRPRWGLIGRVAVTPVTATARPAELRSLC